MKYLTYYTDKLVTEALTKAGAFFAFSKEQLDSQAIAGITYVSLPHGMICPKDAAKELLSSLRAAHAQGIAADIADNGIKAIIHREFGNYECQLTCDFSEAEAALSDYGVTHEQVAAEWGEYFQMCVDNDYF